jgi:Cu/Ag efflux protein CusF
MKAVLLLACVCFVLSFAAPVFACYTIDDASISKVDTEKKTLVVTKGDKTQTFTTADKTAVTVNGKTAKLDDLKAGDKVTIDYEAADDVLRVKVTRES